MPNIAAILKSEIARVARKEVRSETTATKKASSVHRSEIATLKRRVQALEKQLRQLVAHQTRQSDRADPQPTSGPGRFSPKGLKSLRDRLGLSAHSLGLLIGASSQSVYNWEDGKTRPQAKYLAAIAFVKTKGKKEITARLNDLQA